MATMRTSDRLTLTTYNIRLGTQEGLESIAREIRRHPLPDVLALQEVGEYWTMGPPGPTTQTLAELLDIPHHFHAPALRKPGDNTKARYGHSLLSRWPVEERTMIALPQGIDEPRVLLHTVLRTHVGPLEVLSTHLSHKKEDRLSQGEFLLQWLRNNAPAEDVPRVLLGDLNADLADDPDDQWLEELTSLFDDADRQMKRRTYPSDAPRLRLDYIFALGLDLLDVQVGANPKASDHLLVNSTWTW